MSPRDYTKGKKPARSRFVTEAQARATVQQLVMPRFECCGALPYQSRCNRRETAQRYRSPKSFAKQSPTTLHD